MDEPDGPQSTVDDAGASKPIVIKQLRKMVDENDGEPVPREGVVWACTSEMGKASAEHALDELLKQGDVMDTGDGVIPT